MEVTRPPKFLAVGKLQRTYLLPPNGTPHLDKPGGNLLYASAGMLLWEENVGLIARVGEDYPREWLEVFKELGLDVRGIKVLPQALDLRYFLAYIDLNTHSTDNPVAHFARLGLNFPKALFGYRDTSHELDNLNQLSPISPRQNDLPSDYMHASAVHFCPINYLTHSLLPAVLRQAGLSTITLDPPSGYMDPSFWNHIPSVITGLTAFLCSEEKLRSLFHGRSEDLWEMAEALASYGCEIIVMKRGVQGQLLFDAGSGSRWEMPAYPSQTVDPTGTGDAFCGGFLAGYRKTYDPVEAVLHGNIAASIAIEGTGPFYLLDTLPGLPEARLDSVRQSVRKV